MVLIAFCICLSNVERAIYCTCSLFLVFFFRSKTWEDWGEEAQRHPSPVWGKVSQISPRRVVAFRFKLCNNNRVRFNILWRDFFLIGSEFCLKSSLKRHLPPTMPNSSHGAADSADFVLGIIKHQICSWTELISHGSNPRHVLLCEGCWACPTQQLGGEHKFPRSALDVSACGHLQPHAVGFPHRTKSVTGLCLQNICY